MNLERGQQLTTTIVTNFFKSIILHINSLVQVKEVSTGQVITKGYYSKMQSDVVICALSVYTEQYFDSYITPQYTIYELANTSEVYGGANIIADILNDIQVLEEKSYG